MTNLGNRCGTVGRAIATDNSGLGFKSTDQQILSKQLIAVNFIEETKIKKKRSRMTP